MFVLCKMPTELTYYACSTFICLANSESHPFKMIFFRTSASEIAFLLPLDSWLYFLVSQVKILHSTLHLLVFLCVEKSFFTISGIFNTLPNESFLALEFPSNDFLSPFFSWFLGKCLRYRVNLKLEGMNERKSFSCNIFRFFFPWNSLLFFDSLISS